jgi:hypothetical protein
MSRFIGPSGQALLGNAFSTLLDEAMLEPEASTAVELGFDQEYDLSFVPDEIRRLYEVHSWRNAAAVLANTHHAEWNELLQLLRTFRLKKSHLTKRDDSGAEVARGGGRKSLIAQSLDEPLYENGWIETLFETEVQVHATRIVSTPKIGKHGQTLKQQVKSKQIFKRFNFRAPTHKVDCYKNKVAVEVEWNNKNPFFDRDLNNFRLLFDLRVIEVGVIVTRCNELDEIFSQLLTKEKARERYGSTTTRMSKLIPLLKGGGGGGCPVLVFGIGPKLYTDEE